LGLKAYKQNGFISVDDDSESVSKTLEYAYDDWCIAQMAEILNKKEDYDYFMKRSQNWKNLFNYKTGFIQPKKNGGWQKPFDPKEVTNNYTEANAWQYTFFVPQDIPGMIKAFGGKEKFEAKLDEMFNSESKTTGREQADVTGLIGQYAHGNEPSHHMAYLYNYIGKPKKTAEKVKFILDNFYKNSPDGLIGNEDCGQMSAWYVLSSIGLYKVTPGSNTWETAKPYFKKIKIKINGKKAENISQVIATLNNSTKKSEVKNDYPLIITVPIIEAENKSFQDKMKVEITSQNTDDEIYYLELLKNHDYSTEKLRYIKYTEPLYVEESATISTYVKRNEKNSNIISAQFFKKPNNYSISIKSKVNSQYAAGGSEALIDGIYGDENWKKGEWQGYQSQDFEAIIDLKETKKINQISADFLQDSRSWILMPTKIDYFVSHNNKDYFLMKTITTDIDPRNNNVITKKYTAETLPTEARYVKIKAYNFGKLPEWHQGFGGDAFIFIDEIEVK
ncbi:MAG: glycoside hydrolase family 92 protein, partial [Chryseobacterium sp.]|nr:glycoside hydrolase family 92 protein [Chryseobacterium sp.]